MISSIFNFLHSLLSLLKLVITNIVTKLHDNRDEIQSKFDKASADIKKRYDIS